MSAGSLEKSKPFTGKARLVIPVKDSVMEEIERSFVCPCCGENISMLLDLSAKQQQYIEDCEVCCRPVEIKFSVEENSIQSWSASRADS